MEVFLEDKEFFLNGNHCKCYHSHTLWVSAQLLKVEDRYFLRYQESGASCNGSSSDKPCTFVEVDQGQTEVLEAIQNGKAIDVKELPTWAMLAKAEKITAYGQSSLCTLRLAKG